MEEKLAIGGSKSTEEFSPILVQLEIFPAKILFHQEFQGFDLLLLPQTVKAGWTARTIVPKHQRSPLR